ncbi:GLPGLI family protein [Chryseobacterium sp. 16F]|uniref:GLPGLI family protein n=2 Tax=Frigoriflavimonas asaccharolytica TaxID=2735899 RepID=A0A8J8G8R1_9FLAO|nr:GLPGLI family protein [Frigoriflavimonas asaccharolytica]
MKLDSSLTVKDVTVLDINKNSCTFYSNEYLKVDSLNKAHNTYKFAYPNFKKIITKKENEDYIFINSMSMATYYYPKKIKLKWILSDDKKVIGKFSVQKATTNYGGRKWTAWFTNEIPLPYGPYIFYDLPGLVLEVYDNANDYHFTFVENKNLLDNVDKENILEKYLGKNKFEIKLLDWQKILFNYYNNPIPEYKDGNARMVGENGQEYTANDYREVEKQIQTKMKRYNNPIELDEKVEFK